jgi:hypothetical protein
MGTAGRGGERKDEGGRMKEEGKKRAGIRG